MKRLLAVYERKGCRGDSKPINERHGVLQKNHNKHRESSLHIPSFCTNTGKKPRKHDKKNVVIMGRKTWFSIPEKFRPLKGRVNIVLSRELKEVPEGVHIARSLPEALSLVETEELSDSVENVHIIGGSSVYQEAMAGPFPCRIYLTKVLKDFDCDAFLPEIKEDKFRKITNPENVPVDLQEDDDIKFRFEVYEKEMEHGTDASGSVHQAMECHGTSLCNNGPIKFDVMAAMCHGNRGIGYEMGLPWPSLKKDYNYYTSHVSTMRDTNADQSQSPTRVSCIFERASLFFVENVTNREGSVTIMETIPTMSAVVSKKIIHIRGRYTWIYCHESEKIAPNVYHVVVSTTLSDSDCEHPRMIKVVPTFDDAMVFINDLYQRNEVDSVWIMGGSKIYQEAFLHPQCYRLFLTHVYTDFQADAFFPKFEDKFREIDDHQEKGVQHEESGVKYEFKVYEKISES